MPQGKFITFEGGEGSGKTTQLYVLKGFLEQKAIPVLITREPGGSVGAELIRPLLVKGEAKRWDAITEALLLNAARRDHLVSVIFPALKQGTWVICDRFADSTLAYQGYGHGVALQDLNFLYHLIAGTFKPDVTFIFDLDPEQGLKRTHQRHNSEDRYERLDPRFHERLREGYQHIAQSDPSRYIMIDASLPLEKITQKLIDSLALRFDLEG